MLGSLEDGKLALEEIHRFPNGAVVVRNSMRWDVLRLFEELKTGLRKVAARGIPVESVSCDSWGVDYVLLKGDGSMLAAPFHYRDKRTDDAFERAFAVVPADKIFDETGIQFMPINTLYQLLADLEDPGAILGGAARFLNIGDYFNFLLCGEARAEESLASTTQLYNPQLRTWSPTLIERFGLPARIFPEVVPSGTVLGPLLPAVSAETGLQSAQVVAGCSHDTGAAVAAVPAEGEGWAYLSSGTWSLVGVETLKPIINTKSREYNFTNEIGYAGSIRFLKNIIGLWMVQECRRNWAKEGKEYTYEQLTDMAEAAAPRASYIDAKDPSFSRAGNMPSKIADYCRSTNQFVPSTPGEVIRCVLESLALLYRQTIDQIEDVTGQAITTLHIVGGGSKNRQLNQLTANALGRTVLAGPVECSAIGNVLIQAIALGHVPSLRAGREIVRRSFPLVRYDPADSISREKASARESQLNAGRRS
jgi:rhamnulokinase